MDDDELLDRIYQAWSQTTGAQTGAWSASEDEGMGCWDLWWSQDDAQRKPVAAFLNQENAEFIAVIHSALPALIRRFRAALDEAERLDTEKDTLTGQLAEAELALQSFQQGT